MTNTNVLMHSVNLLTVLMGMANVIHQDTPRSTLEMIEDFNTTSSIFEAEWFYNFF